METRFSSVLISFRIPTIISLSSLIVDMVHASFQVMVMTATPPQSFQNMEPSMAFTSLSMSAG